MRNAADQPEGTAGPVPDSALRNPHSPLPMRDIISPHLIVALDHLLICVIMSSKSDRWLRRMARDHGMIEPYEDRQVRKGVISYGVSSYGYDMRVAREFRIFTNVLNSSDGAMAVDPMAISKIKGDVCIVAANSFARAGSWED